MKGSANKENDVESKMNFSSESIDNKEKAEVSGNAQHQRKRNGLRQRYRRIANWYDRLDKHWEFTYRHWRPRIVGGISGDILELGVGTGQNLQYYSFSNEEDSRLTAIDLSPEMLKRAKERVPDGAEVRFVDADACQLPETWSYSYDWVVSTFLFCVLPDELQPAALDEMARVLKPGGKFRIVEIVYSKNFCIKGRQMLFAPWVKWAFGARFDRKTIYFLEKHPDLVIDEIEYLKADTHMLIHGHRRSVDEHVQGSKTG